MVMEFWFTAAAMWPPVLKQHSGQPLMLNSFTALHGHSQSLRTRSAWSLHTPWWADTSSGDADAPATPATAQSKTIGTVVSGGSSPGQSTVKHACATGSRRLCLASQRLLSSLEVFREDCQEAQLVSKADHGVQPAGMQSHAAGLVVVGFAQLHGPGQPQQRRPRSTPRCVTSCWDRCAGA